VRAEPTRFDVPGGTIEVWPTCSSSPPLTAEQIEQFRSAFQRARTGDVQIIGIGACTRLHLARVRASNRLFCWLARHAPRLAEVWAFRR
jgi:hypothetical protein